MPKGTFRQKELRNVEQYAAVNDEQLRLTLAAIANRYSDKVKAFIYACYNDDHLMGTYRAIRNSGIYEKGGENRRKLVEYPNGYVFDFIDTVMNQLYGPGWQKNNKALTHDLIKPWWVVNHL